MDAMNAPRRSERIKKARMAVIRSTNICFPRVESSTDEMTYSVRAAFSLPVIAEVRRRSPVKELANQDPAYRVFEDQSVSQEQSADNTHDEYDLLFMGELSELEDSDPEGQGLESQYYPEGEERKDGLSELEESDPEGQGLESEYRPEGEERKSPALRGSAEDASLGGKRSRDASEVLRTTRASAKKRRTGKGGKGARVHPPSIALESMRPTEARAFKPNIDLSLKGKERKALRNQQYREHKRQQKARLSTKVLQATNFDVAHDPRHTSTRWSGVNARKDQRSQIAQEIKKGLSRRIEDELTKVPYIGHYRTRITDTYGRLFMYRSNLTPYILKTLLPSIIEAAAQFVRDVPHPYNQSERKNNARGMHWFSIAGHDRNNKEHPALSAWHKDNSEVIDSYFQPGKPFWHLTNFGCRILSDNFPAIAARYRQSAEYMKATYGIEPFFGYFWNWCLNAPIKGVERVFCKPHIDFKNIALGVCMVFVYGHFNHREKCWLVVWEAGLILELPPGVFILYPSSLFLHFNIDISNLPIVVTDDGERPTPESARPFFCDCSSHEGNQAWQEAEGRGSIVWFNQATMFQTSELGVPTILKGRALGMKTDCDAEEWLVKRQVFPTM